MTILLVVALVGVAIVAAIAWRRAMAAEQRAAELAAAQRGGGGLGQLIGSLAPLLLML